MPKHLMGFFSLFLLFAMPAMAQQATYQKTDRGVELTFPASLSSIEQKVRLDVFTDKIIHVVAHPGKDQPAKSESLIIVDSLHAQSGKWDLVEQGSDLLLKTNALTATVSLETGAVSFRDHQGNSLLSEQRRSLQTFTADAYDGDAFYQIKQGFNIKEDEGLYGLGQHQDAVMNYKGRQVTLLQYNTEVAVPFLLSTNNYGILWHNYSITKAGDIRPLLPLSAFKLYSADGQQGWLTAAYYKKDNLATPVISRPESEISYSYLTDMHKFPEDFDLTDALVRYEGAIESPYNGLHRLHVKYAGYLKIWVDGELLADRWRESWNAGTFELDLELEKGKKYQLKMEWLPDGGQSYLVVQTQSPIPEASKNIFAFDSEAGDAVDYYFIAGENMDDVIGGYRYLTGRATIMPQWSFGYWQSRERYKTQKELLDVAAEFRKRRIPIDNMVQDWSYWAENDWGSHDFDKSRFPDAKQMISKLHAEHFRLMISVWPKVNEESSVYPYFKDKGWLYMRNIADARKDWIGKGYTSTFYDPFNADARKGFWDLMNEKLYSIGVDAWWMDASEPDMHSNINMEERKSLMQPSIGSSVRYYNAFPLENAKGIYEGQRQSDPNNRVFILTRSSFAGQQRYAAATWSGDIASRWHDMKDQISAGVNFSMSGTPYWTMDAGGFLVEKRFHNPNASDLEEWREMNARWFQYGAFLPMFRAHGQFPFREPFNIAPEGHPAYNSMLYYIKLRYRMLPYNYSLAGLTYLNNYSMIRGLAMDFPQDKNVYNINDQYMFGPALLINPVTEKGKTSRSVYLPAGHDWYDFYNGNQHKGGQNIEADAPFERMPLFVKSGSILPLGPELQYTNEKKASEITLYIYAGADGEFTLYEDEGTTYDYEKGDFTTITLSYKESDKTLTIGNRTGSFKGMLNSRVFNIVYVSSNDPKGFDSNQSDSKKVNYKGKEVRIKLI